MVKSHRKPDRPPSITRKAWRAARRSPGPLDHETGEKFAADASTTVAVQRRMHRVYWNLKGVYPPPMDSEGRPRD